MKNNEDFYFANLNNCLGSIFVNFKIHIKFQVQLILFCLKAAFHVTPAS